MLQGRVQLLIWQQELGVAQTESLEALGAQLACVVQDAGQEACALLLLLLLLGCSCRWCLLLLQQQQRLLLRPAAPSKLPACLAALQPALRL